LKGDKIDELLKYLLYVKIRSNLADVVKEKVIDQITKEHRDYVLHGVNYYFTLKNISDEKFKNYYKCNVKQTFF